MPTSLEERPSTSISRLMELVANVAVTIVAVLFSVVLARNYLLPTSTSKPLLSRLASNRPADLATAGTNLSKRISDIAWNKKGPTLLLALSTHCHFCTESTPFFRQIRESGGKNLRLIGVLPESVDEAKSYLNREGLHLDEVRQIPLSKVGVAGTPTMLLVNSNGVVTQTWVGRLDPDKQAQVMRIISAADVKKRGDEL